MSEGPNSVSEKGAASQKKQLPAFPEMKGLAFWAGFCSILMIAVGILLIATGFQPALAIDGNTFIAIISGIIFGSVVILTGVSLLESSRQLKNYIRLRRMQQLENAFKRIGLYFRIAGLLVILGIFFVLLVFIVILLLIGISGGH